MPRVQFQLQVRHLKRGDIGRGPGPGPGHGRDPGPGPGPSPDPSRGPDPDPGPGLEHARRCHSCGFAAMGAH